MKIATLITICLFAAAVATAGTAAKPRLVVASTAPLVLKGSGFKSRESVRVVVTSGGASAQKVLRALASGRFTASFASVAVDRCSGMTARAIGKLGSSAVAKSGPLAECPPAP